MDKNTTLNKGVNFLKYVALMNIRFAIFSLQEHCDINITTVREYWTELIDFISVSEIVCPHQHINHIKTDFPVPVSMEIMKKCT